MSRFFIQNYFFCIYERHILSIHRGQISCNLCTLNLFLIPALKDVSEHVGGSATFKYTLPHAGAPIEWIHNGKRIYPEKEPRKYDIITDGLVKLLVIKDLKEDEQGTFGVKVGNKTNTAKLNVQGLC